MPPSSTSRATLRDRRSKSGSGVPRSAAPASAGRDAPSGAAAAAEGPARRSTPRPAAALSQAPDAAAARLTGAAASASAFAAFVGEARARRLDRTSGRLLGHSSPLAARSRRQSRFRHNMPASFKEGHTLVRGRAVRRARATEADRMGLSAFSTIFSRRRGQGCGPGGCGDDARRLRRAGPGGDAAAGRIAVAAAFARQGPGLRHRRRAAARLRAAVAPGRTGGGDPVFTPPDEPPGKPKSAKEIEAIDGDLESIGKRHDALLATFPPSAKAVAAAAAEKKAKSKRKPADAAGAPPL